MSLKKPTRGEYVVVGLVNAGAAWFLALRESWTAVYFGVLALICFVCAVRARPDGSAPSEPSCLGEGPRPPGARDASKALA